MVLLQVDLEEVETPAVVLQEQETKEVLIQSKVTMAKVPEEAAVEQVQMQLVTQAHPEQHLI
jgi:hypothetical protein